MLTSLLFAIFMPQTTINSKPKWVLTFAQEFDGKAGTAPDRKVWSRDTGGGGFGNNELQSCTDGNKNSFLDGKGNLILEARKEKTTGEDNVTRDYSSARLKTSATFTQTYGRIEARMKMPKGKGIWPAFWMLGADIAEVSWPKCGEIDIMEFLGHETGTVHGTIHGPGYSGGSPVSAAFVADKPLSDGFHVYAVEWEPEQIRWYLNDKLYHTATPNDIGTNDWVYNKPFFIILNLAVGGNWPGNPDDKTTFPQQLVVDYVRAYKDENLKIDHQGIQQRTANRKLNGPTYNWPGPFQIPGTVTLADYNKGGSGVAYHDSDPQNNGGQFRAKEGVDVGASGAPGARFSVGWTKAGEWLTYDIKVPTAGTFKLQAKVASDGPGGVFHLEIDGKRIGDESTVPDTGGWTNWRTIDIGTATLSAGAHVLKLKMAKESEKTGSIGNMLSIQFLKP